MPLAHFIIHIGITYKWLNGLIRIEVVKFSLTKMNAKKS